MANDSRFIRTGGRTFFAGLILALATLIPSAAIGATNTKTTADTSDSLWKFAIGVEGGTAGLGPVAVISANKYLSANIGYTWLNYDHSYDSDKIDYNGTLKLSNIQAILNYHPFAGTFHISAGFFACNNKVELTGKAKNGTSYTIGDTTYTASDVGKLYGDADLMDGLAPFVGLGWSKSPQGKGFGFTFDIGVLFIDSPEVSLSATGPVASNEIFLENLRQEEDDINDDLDSYKLYPIVQLGVIYRF